MGVQKELVYPVTNPNPKSTGTRNLDRGNVNKAINNVGRQLL
jgi:hypothetical protein